MTREKNILPSNLPPRGLELGEAAQYWGIGKTLFLELVKEGRAPQPKRINSRTVWDRHALDRAFDALPENGDSGDDVWSRARV